MERKEWHLRKHCVFTLISPCVKKKIEQDEKPATFMLTTEEWQQQNNRRLTQNMKRKKWPNKAREGLLIFYKRDDVRGGEQKRSMCLRDNTALIIFSQRHPLSKGLSSVSSLTVIGLQYNAFL